MARAVGRPAPAAGASCPDSGPRAPAQTQLRALVQAFRLEDLKDAGVTIGVAFPGQRQILGRDFEGLLLCLVQCGILIQSLKLIGYLRERAQHGLLIAVERRTRGSRSSASSRAQRPVIIERRGKAAGKTPGPAAGIE